MKKYFFLVIFFVVLHDFAQGYKHYTVEQGLPSNRIYKILQDYNGFIWIATDKGLSEFDGYNFKTFTIASGLPSNDIWETVLTKDNKLWYITRSNRMGYIKNDSVYAFKTQNNGLLYPTMLSTDLKRLYLINLTTNSDKNYQLKNGQWQKISTPPVLESQRPIALIHPVYRFSYYKKNASDKISYIITDSLLQRSIKFNFPYKDIYIKGQINDSLIAATSRHGIHFINLNNGKAYHIIKPDIFKKNIFTRILATDNDIQISTENFWARLDKNFQLKDIKFFPEKFHLATVFKDREGNFWGTTYAQGVYFFPRNALSSKNLLTNEPVQFIKLTGNNLFAAILYKGIYKYNPGLEKFEKFFDNKDYFFDIFYADNDNFAILANTTTFIKRNGVLDYYYPVGKGILYLGNDLFAIRERDKISIFNSKNFELKKSYPIKGSNDFILYNKHIVCGTAMGVFIIENDAVNQIEIDRSKPEIPVLSLAQTGKHLIIGTDGLGAYIWDGKHQMKLIKDTKEFIINNIYSKKDTIWLATQKGVFSYYFDNNNLVLNKIMRKSDGIISNHVNQVAVFHNKIITADFNGITSVNKNILKKIPVPKLYFETVKFNGKIIRDNEHVKYKKNNNLFLNFGLIDFTEQVNNRYFYQLLPVQENWLEIHSKNINFNDLKPDSYSFKIKTITPYGQEATKSFRFIITPLWWQTTGVRILFTILILSGIFFVAYYYRRKALKKQRTRLLAQKQMAEFELHALRSQMNPHFVFNSLNAILYYINDENYDQSETYLIKFSKLIRMIFEFSRKKDIPIRQEVELLESYLNLEKMRFSERLNFCINIDPQINIDKRTIPTLLLQPIVENAVNHGIFHKKGKGTICVEFRYIDENSYEVLIKDDGVGITKSAEINKKSLKKHQSRSTQILMDRIKLLNKSGKWHITYQMLDKTEDKQTTYNTIVKLKITKL